MSVSFPTWCESDEDKFNWLELQLSGAVAQLRANDLTEEQRDKRVAARYAKRITHLEKQLATLERDYTKLVKQVQKYMPANAIKRLISPETMETVLGKKSTI